MTSKRLNLNAVFEVDLHEDDSGKYFWMPPHSYVLGVAEEAIKLPRDITVVAVGKSSYARIGILCNITPAEAGWEGHLPLEIANMSPDFNKLYANEGVTQLIFHRGTPCEVSYKDRKGKYQGQKKKWSSLRFRNQKRGLLPGCLVFQRSCIHPGKRFYSWYRENAPQ